MNSYRELAKSPNLKSSSSVKKKTKQSSHKKSSRSNSQQVDILEHKNYCDQYLGATEPLLGGELGKKNSNALRLKATS